MNIPLRSQFETVAAYLQDCAPPLPRENAPPPPVFDQAKWSGMHLAYNCLAYAANSRDNFRESPFPVWGRGRNPDTALGVFNKLVTMGFVPAPPQPGDALPPDIKGYYRAALFVGERPDFMFHLYRKDKRCAGGDLWSEKLPRFLPRNHDDFGKPITDPRAARYYAGAMTTDFASFFYVPNEGLSL